MDNIENAVLDENEIVEDAAADVNTEDIEFKKKDEEEKDEKEKSVEDEAKDEEEKPADSDEKEEDEEEKKKKYNLEEVEEYTELSTRFAAVSAELESLKTAYAELEASSKAAIDSLTNFKNQVEREKKEAMIKSFYMLSDEDKKEVIDNIDKYSLDDIEAKLSVICVRNKVSFNLDDDTDDSEPVTFNLDD